MNTVSQVPLWFQMRNTHLNGEATEALFLLSSVKVVDIADAILNFQSAAHFQEHLPRSTPSVVNPSLLYQRLSVVNRIIASSKPGHFSLCLLGLSASRRCHTPIT